MKKILQYYVNDDNFGDKLNPYIQRAFGIRVKCSPCEFADFIAVGSSMERLLEPRPYPQFLAKAHINIWGTGFHFPIGEHKWYNITLPEKFARPVNVYALRGKLSLKRLSDILNLNTCEQKKIILGDPGLLVNKIFKPAKHKRYRLGIVAHHTEKENPVYKNIQRNIKDSINLDIYWPVDLFIKKLTECEAVISSALHPLIVSDSFGIPNQWVNITRDANISMYKFYDYYSVFEKEAFFFDLQEIEFNEESLTKLKTNYSITLETVEDINKKLIQAHPYSNKVNFLTNFEIKQLNFFNYVRKFRKLILIPKFRKRFYQPWNITKTGNLFSYNLHKIQNLK